MVRPKGSKNTKFAPEGFIKVNKPGKKGKDTIPPSNQKNGTPLEQDMAQKKVRWDSMGIDNEEPIKLTPLSVQTSFRHDYSELLINHMSKGFTFETFGVIVRVVPDTLYEWRKKFPEFEKAYRIGKLAQERFFMALLIKAATTKEMNAAVAIFLAKNRLGMVDVIQQNNQNTNLVITTEIGKDGLITRKTLTQEEEMKLINSSINADFKVNEEVENGLDKN